jgi:23S rRNA (cytosine1962-C5)-methyltransferase
MRQAKPGAFFLAHWHPAPGTRHLYNSVLMHKDYDLALVSAKGARRWQQGHPWIYRSDVTTRPSSPAGAVRVADHRGKTIGVALWSPSSEISLRMVDKNERAELDRSWWHKRLGAAIERRACMAKATRVRR